MVDCTEYIHNDRAQICKTINHSVGIDTVTEDTTTFKYNSYDDIIFMSKVISHQYLPNKDIDKKTSIEEYRYIYDSNDNWIIKITITDDKINSITQRDLKY